jgi:hypothetical protein
MQMQRSRNFSQRQRNGMREVESTRKSIAVWLDQMQLGSLTERRNQEGCTTPDQRKPRRPDGYEPVGEDVDMACGQTDQLTRDWIVPRGVFKNVRSERCEITRRCLVRPGDDGMRIVGELVAQGAQQSGPGDPAIERPEQAADSLAAEPGAAALVGNRHSPSANSMSLSAHDRPTDRAGTGNDHSAVIVTMRAETSRMRIGGDDRPTEGMRIGLGGRQIGRLAGAGQCQTGNDFPEIRTRQSGLAETLRGRIEDFGKALLQAETEVGRSGRRFAKQLAGKGAQPCPATGAAAVNAEQQDLRVHLDTAKVRQSGSSCTYQK